MWRFTNEVKTFPERIAVAHDVGQAIAVASNDQEPQTFSRERRRSLLRRATNVSTAPMSGKWGLWLVLAALALTIVEGGFRKWVGVFGEGIWRYIAYFSKDMVFAALLLLPARRVSSAGVATFRVWLLLGCIFLVGGASISAMETFNPVGAALTIRAAVVLPVIAFFVIPRLKGISVQTAAWLLCVLTILNFGLAVFQNRLPSDHMLNKYAADTEKIVALESGVRATGTFSYISGLGVLSSVGIWAGMVLLSLARGNWQRVGGWAAIVAGFGCGLAAVARGPVVIAAVMVLLWMGFSRASISVAARSIFAGLLLLGLLVAFDVVPILSALGKDLRERHEEAGDVVQERVFGQLGEGYEAMKVAPLGAGLGTEQIAGNFYASGITGFTNFETQLPRLVMEVGVLGMLGFLMICAGAILALQAAKQEVTSDGERAMLLATQLLLLPIFYTNIVFNHTASAFAWMIFSVVLAGDKSTGERGGLFRHDRKARKSRRRDGKVATSGKPL
ncbi:MAG: hypothetical protein L0Y58_16215 [Verrucomicrobia subdivision 3 bacterium]|nr:hypothetical protein [Limisphaerales bacterium]